MKQDALLEQQAEPILELIRYARELDRQGKMVPARHALIAARMKIAEAIGDPISKEEIGKEIDYGRRRVRKAADQAEDQLRGLISNARLWDWTDPDRAIREMRLRYFGGFDHLPLTDIEECLIAKGNVLWIVAVYPALKNAILARLGRATTAAPQPVGAP